MLFFIFYLSQSLVLIFGKGDFASGHCFFLGGEYFSEFSGVFSRVFFPDLSSGFFSGFFILKVRTFFRSHWYFSEFSGVFPSFCVFPSFTGFYYFSEFTEYFSECSVFFRVFKPKLGEDLFSMVFFRIFRVFIRILSIFLDFAYFPQKYFSRFPSLPSFE